jgi:hypothetical protein
MDNLISSKLIKQDRTEEVADIIERMPIRFGFWISVIVASLSLLLIFFGWIIKYPDVLRGPITINTSQAPVKMVAQTAGAIDLLNNKSGDRILQGDYLAVIKNPSKTCDVVLLDSLLKELDIYSTNFNGYRHYFPDNLTLGELSNKYFGFLNSFFQYLDYHNSKPFATQEEILEKLSSSQLQSLDLAKAEYLRLKNKYELAKSFYGREVKLFKDSVIAAAELENAQIKFIATEQEFKAVDKQIISNKYQIEDAVNKVQQLSFQKIDKERQLQVELYNSYYEILENIKQWKRKYVYESPINGRVEFLNFWKNDDFVQVNQDMFTILPEENEMFGQVLLPEQGAGKVKVGAEVIIKLDNYPYAQFGSVKGKVKSISLSTNQQLLSNAQNKINAYLVTVSLPNGLKTNYGSVLAFHYEAKGVAEIVTDQRRLIERLFDNLRHKIN